MQNTWIKWAVTVGVGLLIFLAPRPGGVSYEAWMLLAIFMVTLLLLLALLLLLLALLGLLLQAKEQQQQQ